MPVGPPPDIDPDKLDFSIFHPLDHWPGTARCRSFYGGTRNHLSMAWEYRWSSWLRIHTLCRIGRHDITTVWARDKKARTEWITWKACRHCAYRPPKDAPTNDADAA